MKKLLKAFCLLFIVLISLYGCKTTQKVPKDKSEKTSKEEVKAPTYKDPYEGKDESELTATDKYIIKYRDLAMSEMKRAKIPASIKLAQGILESGNGNSYLAKKANNHFGIKCGTDWTGESIYFDDDQANECFRKFNSVEESYINHSDFLTSSSRYTSLFELDIKDYKAWANGLKEAGYATRRNYAELVIDLIEKNKLDIYDIYLPKLKEEKVAEPKQAESPDKIFKVNGINVIFAKANDTYESIANRYKLGLEVLLEMNDLREPKALKEGQVVYLAPKKTVATETYHIVKAEDNMWSVSQEYGIKLVNLFEKNLMKVGDEPAVGEILYLRQKRTEPIELRKKEEEPKVAENEDYYKKLKDEDNQEEKKVQEPEKVTQAEETKTEENDDKKVVVVIEDDGEEIIIKPKTEENKTTTVTKEEKPEEPHIVKTEENVAETVNTHVVKAGETLHSIAAKYNVSVEDLQKWNKLADDYISVGDKLYVAEREPVRVKVTDAYGATTLAEAGSSVTSGDTVFHIVAEDESLYSISRKYGLTIIDLLALNQMTEYSISTGQKLIVKLSEKAASSATSPATATKAGTTATTTKKEVVIPENAVVHVVQAGETLSAISRKYGISVAKIKELNNLTSDNISTGQKLVVGTGVAPQTGATTVKPETATQPTAAGTKKHVVQSGETLFSISRMYNTSVDKIKNANNLTDDRINVGQELTIP